MDWLDTRGSLRYLMKNYIAYNLTFILPYIYFGGTTYIHWRKIDSLKFNDSVFLWKYIFTRIWVNSTDKVFRLDASQIRNMFIVHRYYVTQDNLSYREEMVNK